MSRSCSRRSFLTAVGITALSAGVLGPHVPAGAAAQPRTVSQVSPPPQTRASRAGVQNAALDPRPSTLYFLPEDLAAIPDNGLLARIRLFGDMHFGFTDPARLAAVERDLADMPLPDALLSTGDETHFGRADEYDSAQSWLRQWQAPFYTVTGNHTFWNWSVRSVDSNDLLYGRFVDNWGLPMPYLWDIGGVRFVGVGPTRSGLGLAEASLSEFQLGELAAVLAAAPSQPTVLVMHAPLHHTVLGDGGPPNSTYTSDDPGFYQRYSRGLLAMLSQAPQVVLIVCGHTHSPLKAQGLLDQVDTGDRLVPQFNAMALPFVRRRGPRGQTYQQDLVSWQLGITADDLILRGRDHLARRDVARAVVPLPRRLPAPFPSTNNV